MHWASGRDNLGPCIVYESLVYVCAVLPARFYGAKTDVNAAWRLLMAFVYLGIYDPLITLDFPLILVMPFANIRLRFLGISNLKRRFPITYLLFDLLEISM